jgi:uncharacterized protein YidB (DUF937 family)
MDLGGLIGIAARSFQQSSASDTDGLDVNAIVQALVEVLGDGNGKLDLGALVGGLVNSGLGTIAASWLGSGENAAISTDQLTEILGADRISALAAKLGASEDSVLSGLQAALPTLIDQASPSGEIAPSLGGGDLIGGLVSSFLR